MPPRSTIGCTVTPPKCSAPARSLTERSMSRHARRTAVALDRLSFHPTYIGLVRDGFGKVA
jgi:hypothetical protein